MKINESQRIANLQKSYGKYKGAGEGAESLRKKDQVSISSEAQELLQSQQATDAERIQKIEELKNSVSAGTYYVDAGKIAEKLLPFIR
ncbi:flagellar biosynthesis anti-sigma factor FlgM [Cohnella silvisoli]|uniref:Negative regulator of flagellin synthesis n=1 Tax=Cohnella silvisoli TaxID=2873699 RepID=A0ABV1KPL9_9BACL|nr:flagellar biosynthesis anti-sigma factor FlgM [Cohnella silvisoli]MCD9022302.1 flagellar biosynthesis anti-sigma factor FlgM [Cohnella silvisoli]